MSPSVMNELFSRAQNAYASMHFASGSAWLYLVAFLLLILLPILLLINYLNYTYGLSIGKVRLPTNKILPIPPPVKIKELRIYPIKSCRGLKVEKAQLLKTGLDLDRHWMFTASSTMKFMTIREIPELTLIDTAVNDNDELEARIRTKPEVCFKIPAHPSPEWLRANTKPTKCEIYGGKFDGHMYSTELTAPFSDFLKKDVRLVYKGHDRVLIGKVLAKVVGLPALATKFPDMAPLLITNQNSLDDLNSRLTSVGDIPITIERFRPNIVVDGKEPWYEDVWKTIEIGGPKSSSLLLDVVFQCPRCRVPNVDPDTAVKQKQPLEMLMSYRRIDKGRPYKAFFGMYCVPKAEGEVSIGMELKVLELTSAHTFLKRV